jgi:resolvase-like protein
VRRASRRCYPRSSSRGGSSLTEESRTGIQLARRGPSGVTGLVVGAFSLAYVRLKCWLARIAPETKVAAWRNSSQLGILCAVAEFEREVIKERVNAGIAAARFRGVKLSRPSTLG